MLVEEWRPKLSCKGAECQNLSPNGKVLFIEEDHKYFYETDVRSNGVIKPFEISKFKFRSPTGILSHFKEYFDSEMQAKKYVKKHKLKITWQELMEQWAEKGRKASEEGTILHAYAESLWNGWDMPRPDKNKTAFVERMHMDISEKFILAKTELLVYSTTLRLAGQVDLLLRNEDRSAYAIMDYKFVKAPLDKKSYYNFKTGGYKMMKGPFRMLHDCNYNHYSIQMEIYRYLMGKTGDKVVSKTLIVVTPDELIYDEGKDIKIWVDDNGVLQAKYKDWKNRTFDSSKDKEYLRNQYKLI